jgi:hypothetical protein
VVIDYQYVWLAAHRVISLTGSQWQAIFGCMRRVKAGCRRPYHHLLPSAAAPVY